jgi:hypothetical protein
MPHVVPTQIVGLIDLAISHAPSSPGARRQLAPYQFSEISAVVDLASELATELLIISGNDYSNFRIGMNALIDMLYAWRNRIPDQRKDMEGFESLCTLRELLIKCPDEAPSQMTEELLFIADVALRDSVRLDISAANRALHEGLWKAATVLAGAAAEALLLWAITTKTATEIEDARQTAAPAKNKDPKYWDLDGYIKVARQLALIAPKTQTAVDLARQYRDLIHPGREARLSEVCDRATALSALAAVESIVRDLS